ncbi:MAG: tRNA uridine-5-carboxymethylaminomethyl(34) synthesis GTPase MnmE [Candidatus Omnitrophica bacterium]|nr:tRNA uridine-5-carboxymethylaminomethyl(34) synthesis GTPase MnmE [Candidatus Omnitrophota bacterium]
MNGNAIKGYDLEDTIAARATAPLPAAIGVIRISGPRALAVVNEIFVPSRKKDLTRARSFTLHHGWIVRDSAGEGLPDPDRIIDEAVVSVMRAPRTYTTEDMVEISCHGGTVVLESVMERVCRQGVRVARPGEFTYRAFMHGRLTLVQAESVAELIEASTEAGAGHAVRQLQQRHPALLESLRAKIMELYSATQAAVNFPEEDIHFSLEKVREGIEQVRSRIGALREASRRARTWKEGVYCVICGKTNAGKSTLFNRFLREDRVIVSNLPGTTRDVIQDTVALDGIPFRVVDTAGLVDRRDAVTSAAVEKSREAWSNADIVLAVCDASAALDRHDKEILRECAARPKAVAVLNKCDLPRVVSAEEIKTIVDIPVIELSALEGEGMRTLEQILIRYAGLSPGQDTIFLSQFQRQVLEGMEQKCADAEEYLAQGHPIDVVDLVFRECVDELAKLTGEVMSEEVLSSIFSRFCVGK